jgi:hypothetical protein
MAISFVGFMHKDDFAFGNKKRLFYRYTARLCATRPVSLLVKYLIFNRPVIHMMYRYAPTELNKIDVTPEYFSQSIDFEARLWRSNHMRTHWLTTSQFLNLDNTKVFIDAPVVHVISKQDRYLNNIVVEQHMRQVYADYKQYLARSSGHMPPVLADKKAMSVFLPAGLRRLLRESSSRNV